MANDPTPVTVRPARLNDAGKLSAFLLQAWAEAGPRALGFAGANPETVKEIAKEDFVRKRLSSPSIQTTIAERGRSVVGFASLRSLGDREAELSGLAVLAGESAAGLEPRLMRKALETARRRGIRLVFARTEMKDARSIALYKQSGFTESGRVEARLGSAKVELRVMQKSLR
jgi:N-acetylglutamate synthase-like GNAT family acetyltransferase